MRAKPQAKLESLIHRQYALNILIQNGVNDWFES